MRSVFLWLVALYAVGCGGATDEVAPGPESIAKTPAAISCVAAVPNELQDVRGVTAAPYLVRHPTVDDPRPPTIMFLPGGSGNLASAQRAWDAFFGGHPDVGKYRVLIPYSSGNDLIDEGQRAFRTLDAVLSCYGGDPGRVHVAGYSNGGRLAYWFMLARPERFASLLGAPGIFPPISDATEWVAALGDRPVFNGVGALDDEWKPSVKATHDALARGGVSSIYVEFPNQGHRMSGAFDKNHLFDFWGKH